MDGGADDEVTLRTNTSAFERDRIVANYLVDVSKADTRTRVLGHDIAWPVFCSPSGSSRFYHADGELAVARAAAAEGTIYSLATMSSHSIETVAQASAGPKLFQLFIFKDRGVTRDLIARCKAAGFSSLCLTVDVAVRGKRERELRSGMGIPMKFTAASLASFALRPSWLASQAQPKGPFCMPTFKDLAGSADIIAQTRYFGSQLDPAIEWKHVGEFIELWGGPFAIKGLLSAEDARRAADVGASAVMVSNHGGRQLDHAAAPYEALPRHRGRRGRSAGGDPGRRGATGDPCAQGPGARRHGLFGGTAVPLRPRRGRGSRRPARAGDSSQRIRPRHAAQRRNPAR